MQRVTAGKASDIKHTVRQIKHASRKTNESQTRLVKAWENGGCHAVGAVDLLGADGNWDAVGGGGRLVRGETGNEKRGNTREQG